MNQWSLFFQSWSPTTSSLRSSSHKNRSLDFLYHCEFRNLNVLIVQLFFPFPVSLRHRTTLKQFIIELFRRERVAISSLTIVFCSDDFLLDVNKQFLQHDDYTDIITFNLASKRSAVEGEVYISVERVKENAWSLGNTVTSELHRVIFHGCLHLCGYADKTEKDHATMRAREDLYLQKYFTALKLT